METLLTQNTTFFYQIGIDSKRTLDKTDNSVSLNLRNCWKIFYPIF